MHIGRLVILLTPVLICCANRLSAATSIPFQFQDGMVWVKVAVAGKNEPLHFLLDSGAGASVLDVATARRLGVQLGAPESVQGVHGRSVAYRIGGFAAHAAGIAIPSSLLALDLSAPSRACHQHIDGLLGVDFFRDRIVQIDFASQTIRLLQRSETDASAGETLPLTKRNGVFCARVSIDGNAPEWLRLDTGCNTALEWVVTGAKARKLRVSTIGVHSSGVREIHADVQIGTMRIAGVKTGIHTEQMFAGEAGLIGNGLLSRFTVTIDAAKRRCLLASW